MNKFKALLIKDWHINKKAILFPIWVILGFYAIIILSSAVAYFKGDLNLLTMQSEYDVPSAAINYIMQIMMTMVPGILMIISTLMISQSALNEDIKKNYELFHRSQPVSCWLRSGSKFIFGTAANWVIFLAILVFNFIITAILLFSLKQFVLYPALTGLLQSFFMFIKSSLVLGAMAFFFSSIFRDKAFFKGIALLLALQFLVFIINLLFQWNIPAPLTYINQLFQGNSVDMEISMMDDSLLFDFMKTQWKEIFFTMKTVYQILFSFVMFGVATWIYEHKEIKID